MTIYKYTALLITVFMLYACGLKSNPVPKGTLDIPYPTAIDYAINSDGVAIYNGSDNYTLFVEKADESIGFFNLAGFKRVVLINPKQTYTDTDVVNNRVYKYRFRHYYGKVKTYSPALMKTIKYYSPIKHSIIKITYERNKRVCVYPGLSDIVANTSVTINGTKMGEAKNGIKTCFDDLPVNSATLSVVAIPYDYDNNTGIPYRQDFKRDTSKLNLPPQNIVVRRNGRDIILTWDKEKNNPKYNIYITTDGKDKFIQQVDVELFRYKATDNKCVDFKLTTIRNNKESKKMSVSACK
ncbi:MAG: hypothetical protein MSA07_11630 [Mucispirillum sp.]|uniref:Uncharacterized protein n=1 Tax=Candidatus Mucispirillum faecigallinarum TaxID=2838699 RepID=A0A9D2GWM6_9BACT|nr:hypothetical protein [Mucispirillum sp.]HIZ90311.1 hypothetical protein [Candidatus Mucispirillum faecigallinarum]